MYFSLSLEQYNNAIEKIQEKATWSFSYTCADWARDVIKSSIGKHIDVDDYFGIETPRELTKYIESQTKTTPKKPTTYEKQNNASSFN